MRDDRIHEVTSPDGTRIAGRVVGQGPPLVLVHSGMGTGDSWLLMLPQLVDKFTCYLPSTRGRGLSGDHPDHSLERHFEDIAAFVEGIGEPVNLFGHSSGATYALGAATQAPAAFRRLCLYEPGIALSPWPLDDLADAGRRVIAEGTVESLLAMIDLVVELTDEERAVVSDPLVVEGISGLVEVAIRDIELMYRSFDEVPIESLTMPTLLIEGPRSAARNKDTTRYLTGRLSSAHVVEIPDMGHLGMLTAPAALAAEVARFCAATREATEALAGSDRQ